MAVHVPIPVFYLDIPEIVLNEVNEFTEERTQALSQENSQETSGIGEYLKDIPIPAFYLNITDTILNKLHEFKEESTQETSGIGEYLKDIPEEEIGFHFMYEFVVYEPPDENYEFKPPT